MRISQLARKYDLSNQELTTFLDGIDPPLKSIHPNAKLSEEVIQQVKVHFRLEDPDTEIADDNHTEEPPLEPPVEDQPLEEVTPVAIEEEIAPPPHTAQESTLTPEEEIAQIEGELADKPLPVTPTPPVAENPTTEGVDHNVPKEEEVILSDQLLEMIEGEDPPSEELEKIKLIKAPKKKLSGLKVLDKIEVPEDPKKDKKGAGQDHEPSVRYTPEERAERAKKRAEYKEKKRLEAKKKKEDYEARKARKEKERESKRLKAIKEGHYKSQLNKSANQGKKKGKKSDTSPKSAMETEKTPKPKTLLGRFWRWLNT